MTILASELFNGGATGATITESAPWSYQLGSGGAASTYQPLAAAHGAEGMRITDIAHQNDVKYDNATAAASFCPSFYFNIRTAPGANAYLCQINDGSNVKVGDFRVNPALTVTLRNSASSAVGTSAVALSTDTWYRVEYQATATVRELKIFLGESTTALIDLTDATTANTCRYAQVGNIAASASGGAVDIDTIQIATAFPGPFNPGGGGGGGGGVTVIATETFESQTNGATITESAPWSYVTSGGTSNICSTSANAHGTKGMRATDTAHQNTVKYDNGAAIASYCDSFYFNIRTTPGALTYLAEVRDASNVKICDFRVNVDLTVTIRNSSSVAVGTSVPALSLSTWYRVEYLVTASGQELKVFLGEAAAPLFDLVGATNGNTARYSYAGIQAAASTGAVDFDTIRIADGFPGPFSVVSRLPYKGQKVTGAGTSTPIFLNRKDA